MDELADLGGDRDHPVFRTNLDDRVTWVVVDFVGVVVHLFEPDQRTHYDLEGLWSDAQVVPRQRETGAPTAPE